MAQLSEHDDVLVWPAFSLRQLVHFVAVADAGNITAAAARLFMSPSAAAASISELERALGAPLFVRRRAQGVFLTPTGQLVLERARALLQDSVELKHLVSGEDQEMAGRLVVGCFSTLAPTVIPRKLQEFRERHPKVVVDFVEGNQEELRRSLLAGEIDVAILYDVGGLDDLAAIELYRTRGYALFHEGHPLTEQATISLDDVASEPMVLFDQAPSSRYAMIAYEEQGVVPNIRHRTHTYELTRSIVARGIAYSILVQRPANKLSYEGLPIVEREVVPPLPECAVVLAWPRGVQLSPRSAALAEVAKLVYSDLGGSSGTPPASTTSSTAAP